MFHKYELCSREEVAARLAPDYAFRTSTGTWGLHGTVRFGQGPNYVFFVTYGQQQAHHTFDEGITTGGILRWQSQPRSDFDSPSVREFIEHDEIKNDILLFLRPADRMPYMYLGKLRYVAHDAERVRPVHFQWRILDFNPTAPEITRFGVQLEADSSMANMPIDTNAGSEFQLTLVPPPVASRRTGVGLPTSLYRSTTIDYEERDRRNRSLGRLGEEIVIKHEKLKLARAGRKDLADKVEHVSGTLGDAAGFDIRSFNENSGVEVHIEVKTTTGPVGTPFFMSANEKVYAENCTADYKLIRLFNVNLETKTAELFEVHKDAIGSLEFTAVSFRVRAL